MVEYIKTNLQKALKSQLTFAIGNLEQLQEKIPNVDVYRLASTSYRFLTTLLHVYSDLVVEMIASPYTYKAVTFFVLDTKFLVWKAWLETLSALYRFYLLDKSINGNFPNIVLDLTKCAKLLYEDMLRKKQHEFGEYGELIDYFLKLHDKTYNTFYERLSSIVSTPINSEIDAFNQIQKIAQEITLWMQYTTLEIISLDRCLYGDKSIVVGASTITVIFKTGLNMVKEIKELLGIENPIIRFSSPDLAKYEYLFAEEAVANEIA